jgi:hypothetical protein
MLTATPPTPHSREPLLRPTLACGFFRSQSRQFQATPPGAVTATSMGELHHSGGNDFLAMPADHCGAQEIALATRDQCEGEGDDR